MVPVPCLRFKKYPPLDLHHQLSPVSSTAWQAVFCWNQFSGRFSFAISSATYSPLVVLVHEMLEMVTVCDSEHPTLVSVFMGLESSPQHKSSELGPSEIEFSIFH